MRTVLCDLIFQHSFNVFFFFLLTNTRLLHIVSQAYIRSGSGRNIYQLLQERELDLISNDAPSAELAIIISNPPRRVEQLLY